MSKSLAHLYFHIPFCASICPYCSFHVETPGKNKGRAFLDALLQEVEMQGRAHELRPRTIYFGGGTPSMLSPGEIEYLLGGLCARLDLSKLTEWTFEVNPATISEKKARLLRSFGVNRISIGVQSWSDRLLKVLGRTHSAAAAEETFALLRGAGFRNVNIDLMFAVPTQTRSEWRATLEQTIALAPEHISAYCLTYEEDTEFFRQLQLGAFRQDEQWDADLFEMTAHMLGAAGFQQYEISNFARSGFESAHNRAYWSGADYLGFGPSAFSTVGAERWKNVPDSAAYVARVLRGESPLSFSESVPPDLRRREMMAFGLRTSRGIAAEDAAAWREEVREFQDLGLLREAAGRLVLTPRGKLLADSVAEAFV